uniref:Uncharacterized protein n=1 Tax=Neovison vison TaxID=452646 RepID=A0A8C7BRG3_NEOVI
MRRAMEMYSKACLWKARTLSASPPGTGAGGEAEAGAGAARELLLAAMRAREKRWQSHTKRSPRWKATKRSSAKPTNSGINGKKKVMETNLGIILLRGKQL